MARLVTCGFEQQQIGTAVSRSEGQGANFAAAATISTSVVHGGAASLQLGNQHYIYFDPNGASLSKYFNPPMSRS